MLQYSTSSSPYTIAPIPLRPYQLQAFHAVDDAYEQGLQAFVLSMSTGAGKTRTAIACIRSMLSLTEHALFLVPSIDLVEQTYKAFCAFFHPSLLGCVQGEINDVGRWITIASVDTIVLENRMANLLAAQRWKKFQVVFADEAHGSRSESYRKIFAAVLGPDSVCIGMTATPFRHDRKSLEPVFPDGLIFSTDMLDLTLQGYLVNVEPHIISTNLDMKSVQLLGQYEDSETIPESLQKRILQSNRYAKAFLAWQEIIEGGPTLYFGNDLSDCYSFQEFLQQKGLASDVITGNTRREKREEVLELCKAGIQPIMINYDVYTTGSDFPWLRGIILGRSSLMGENPNMVKFMQILGRVIRPWLDEQGKPVLNEKGEVAKPDGKLIFLTDRYHQNIPQAISGYSELFGSIVDAKGERQRKKPIQQLEEAEEDLVEKEVVDELKKEPEYHLQIDIRLREVRSRITDIFAGDGWQNTIEGDFIKHGPLGTMICEKQGLNSFAVFHERNDRRTRILTDCVSAKEARQRAGQYLVRQSKQEQMRQGKRTEESDLPLRPEQIGYLQKRKNCLTLPNEWETRFKQSDYFKLEVLLKKHDQQIKGGKRWYRIKYNV